jgi:glycosyltransferase involved in cell wall biosynthesis
MAKENVLFFLYRLYGGGGERVISNLSQDLAESYQVKIAIFDTSEQTYPYKGELIRIKLPFSKDTAGNNRWARAVRLIVLIYQLKKIKRQHRIDVAISFAEQANIINVLTRGKTRTILSVRTILSKHILEAANPNTLEWLIRRLYNRAHHIIVPSKAAGRDLIANFIVSPLKLEVIYNYVDQERITRMSMEIIDDLFLSNLFQQPILLNVGRVTPAKGQWLLFELIRKIKPQFPDWKLVIIGEAENEGPLKSQLIDLAEKLGLKLYDHSMGQQQSLDYEIYLLGYQENPFRFMRKSKVLLFPSVFEGFPNTVLEAMQCGLPVIVADSPSGAREIIAPDSDPSKNENKTEFTKYGILAPSLPTADISKAIDEKTIHEWVVAVITLIGDTDLQTELIQNGYIRVKDFDKQSILKQWKESIVAE